MSSTILGLEVDQDLPEGIMPYSAVTIVKAMDNDGDEVHAVILTENISAFEASGLINFGQLYINDVLRKTFKGAKNRPSSQK